MSPCSSIRMPMIIITLHKSYICLVTIFKHFYSYIQFYQLLSKPNSIWIDFDFVVCRSLHQQQFPLPILCIIMTETGSVRTVERRVRQLASLSGGLRSHVLGLFSAVFGGRNTSWRTFNCGCCPDYRSRLYIFSVQPVPLFLIVTIGTLPSIPLSVGRQHGNRHRRLIGSPKQ